MNDTQLYKLFQSKFYSLHIIIDEQRRIRNSLIFTKHG